MTYELSPAQIEEINSKLPTQFATLKDKYPSAIYNAAEAWDLSPYPEGYVPKTIEVYYEDDANGPAMSIDNGKLTYIELEDPVANPVMILMEIDAHPAYIQLEGRVILNRIGGALLPAVAVNAEVLLQSVLNGIPTE